MPPPVTMVELATNYFVPQALYVVTTLGIAELLKDGARDAAQLASATNVDERSLYRLLRMLASAGVFVETRSGTFKLNPLAATLCMDHPNSMRSMVLMNGSPPHWRCWGDLMFSIQTGRASFEHLYQMPVFDFLSKNNEYGKVFDDAMTNFSTLVAAAVVSAYNFATTRHLVDVGGGNGRLISGILQAYPAMRGTLFDMPSVVARAPDLLQGQGVVDRCDTAGGSFFDSVPDGGDTYILKNIIHDWGDEPALRILQNCHAAMPSNGKLLLVEMVIPHGNSPMFGKLLDLDMLVTNGGCERTQAEFADLLGKAGFRLTRIVPTALPISIIEAELHP